MVVALAGGIGQLRLEEAGATGFSAWSTTNRTGPLIYTNENRTVITSDAVAQGVAGTHANSSGKRYFEVAFSVADWGDGRQSMGGVVVPWNPGSPIGGQVAAQAGLISRWGPGPDSVWGGQWTFTAAGWDTGWGQTPAMNGDVLGVAIDFNYLGMYVCGFFHVNGVWRGGGQGFSSTFDPARVDYNFGLTGVAVILPACSIANYGTATLNVGNEESRYIPPGFDFWG